MRVLLTVLALIIAPLVAAGVRYGYKAQKPWYELSWASSGQAPDPATHPAAMVQIYTARTYGWKGMFAVHSWIAFKREKGTSWDRYEVVGWGVGDGRPAVRHDMRTVDGYWAGSRPTLALDLRGPVAAAAIPEIEAAIKRYPYPDRYVTWPGPNSNTFTAWVMRQVPVLEAELPPVAIGKDFLGRSFLAAAPSGTGVQLSLFGLIGVTLAWQEGVELNVLGLVLGLDPLHLAVKLPGLGSLSLKGAACAPA